jgi:hypothetical protein
LVFKCGNFAVFAEAANGLTSYLFVWRHRRSGGGKQRDQRGQIPAGKGADRHRVVFPKREARILRLCSRGRNARLSNLCPDREISRRKSIRLWKCRWSGSDGIKCTDGDGDRNLEPGDVQRRPLDAFDDSLQQVSALGHWLETVAVFRSTLVWRITG